MESVSNFDNALYSGQFEGLKCEIEMCELLLRKLVKRQRNINKKKNKKTVSKLNSKEKK